MGFLRKLRLVVRSVELGRKLKDSDGEIKKQLSMAFVAAVFGDESDLRTAERVCAKIELNKPIAPRLSWGGSEEQS